MSLLDFFLALKVCNWEPFYLLKLCIFETMRSSLQVHLEKQVNVSGSGGYHEVFKNTPPSNSEKH